MNARHDAAERGPLPDGRQGRGDAALELFHLFRREDDARLLVWSFCELRGWLELQRGFDCCAEDASIGFVVALCSVAGWRDGCPRPIQLLCRSFLVRLRARAAVNCEGHLEKNSEELSPSPWCVRRLYGACVERLGQLPRMAVRRLVRERPVAVSAKRSRCAAAAALPRRRPGGAPRRRCARRAPKNRKTGFFDEQTYSASAN